MTDILQTSGGLSQLWKPNIKGPLVMSAAPTPPCHNTEDVVVVLGAVLAVEAGAELDRTVITGTVIVSVDNITRRIALMILAVLQKKNQLLQLQKKNENAATEVSSCTSNRGYDCVITLAQQGKSHSAQILFCLTPVLCAPCAMISVWSMMCSISIIMVYPKDCALCPMGVQWIAIRLGALAHYRSMSGTMPIPSPTSCRCLRLSKNNG